MNINPKTPTMRGTLAALLLAMSVATAIAGPRTSTNYSVPTDTADAGGNRTTSAAYTHDGSAGGIVGISTVAAPAETAKSGYVGQLYDVTGLTPTAATTNVNEGATLQLGAWQALDDSTFLAVPAASVAWSTVNGPLSISSGGLATAGAVYQNTSATAQGIALGFTGTLGLTVVNTLPDNFGTYAADGITDAWQVQYFGEGNALAAPGVDADGDGQNNLTEFRAGYIPTNASSRFTTRSAAPLSRWNSPACSPARATSSSARPTSPHGPMSSRSTPRVSPRHSRSRCRRWEQRASSACEWKRCRRTEIDSRTRATVLRGSVRYPLPP